MLTHKDLKVGDNVIADSFSSIASGGHEGEVVKIDDNFVYTQIGEDVEKWDKETLINSKMRNYFLAWKTEETYRDYYDSE